MKTKRSASGSRKPVKPVKNVKKQPDRASLDQMMNQYLNAMVGHDPSQTPLASKVWFTENTIAIKTGQGLWGTITGVSQYRMQFADPKTGQAGFMGRVLEHDKPRYMAARLKVEGSKITEIETIVARNIEMPQDVNAKAIRPDFFISVPVEQRTSRIEMIAAVNHYFESIEQGNSKLAPFGPEYVRVENGLQTTGLPWGFIPETPQGLDIGGMGCEDQISTNIFGNIKKIDRRIWLLDEELGVVFGLFIFNTDGCDTMVRLSIGEMIPPINEPMPASIAIAELFRITDGKIRQIEAVFGAPLPFGAKGGW